MQECSVKDMCLYHRCYECDIAQSLASAEKPPATYVTAHLTDEQFNMLVKDRSIEFKKSYHLLPNNAFVWFWIAMAVIFASMAVYK